MLKVAIGKQNSHKEKIRFKIESGETTRIHNNQFHIQSNIP